MRLTSKSTEALLKLKIKQLWMVVLKLLPLSRKKEFSMSDLNIVLMFCAAYSGVVVFSLWMTVTEKTEMREIAVTKGR